MDRSSDVCSSDLDWLVNGDRGYAAVGEVALRPLRSGRFAKSELYSFADYADVTLLERAAIPRTDIGLGSWGGGVRLSYADNATIRIEIAAAWDHPCPGYDQDSRVTPSRNLSSRPVPTRGAPTPTA